MSYPSSTKTRTWVLVKPRIPWSVLVKIFTGTCTTVETCGASVGGFTPAPVESDPVTGITCKINRCNQSYFAVLSLASPKYGCIFILTAAPSTSRVYLATGWSNLSRGLYPCPHINPKELQIAQQIIHICDGRHMQEVRGCSPFSWWNSATSYSFVLSSFTLFFLVLRATFNGDIQYWDKCRLFNHPIPYWNLESISPFPNSIIEEMGNMPLALSWTLKYGFLFNLNRK